jgi:hypothetical protein
VDPAAHAAVDGQLQGVGAALGDAADHDVPVGDHPDQLLAVADGEEARSSSRISVATRRTESAGAAVLMVFAIASRTFIAGSSGLQLSPSWNGL